LFEVLFYLVDLCHEFSLFILVSFSLPVPFLLALGTLLADRLIVERPLILRFETVFEGKILEDISAEAVLAQTGPEAYTRAIDVS
jgi:hypothetical protein